MGEWKFCIFMFCRSSIFSLDFKQNLICKRENGSLVFLCSTKGEFSLFILRTILFPRGRMEVSYFCVLRKKNFFLHFKENIISTREIGSVAFLSSVEGEIFPLILRRILFLCTRKEVLCFCVPRKENFLSCF